MNSKRTILYSAIAIAIGSASSNTYADVTSVATLSFTLGTKQDISCNYGTTPPCNKASYAVTDIVGSYFAMDQNDNGPEPGEKTPIGSLNGIIIGANLAASGSHSGPIDGSENPNIDNPWIFFGGTGMHQTISPVTVLTGAGAVRTMDFSGWNITWNGIDSIPMVATSNTTITCQTTACANNESYIVDGAFHVNGAGFTSVPYFLHLEGTISGDINTVPPDTDNDGIPDFQDKCPNDFDPDQLDVDGDGVNDACDNCAPLINPGQDDNNANGIGDVCDLALAAFSGGDVTSDDLVAVEATANQALDGIGTLQAEIIAIQAALSSISSRLDILEASDGNQAAEINVIRAEINTLQSAVDSLLRGDDDDSDDGDDGDDGDDSDDSDDSDDMHQNRSGKRIQ